MKEDVVYALVRRVALLMIILGAVFGTIHLKKEFGRFMHEQQTISAMNRSQYMGVVE